MDSAQEAQGERATAGEGWAGAGRGDRGLEAGRNVGDSSDGFEVFVSCI